jgi:hypothetical protein
MSASAYPSSCGTVANGETEDYTLNITQTPDMQQNEPLEQVYMNDLRVFPNPVSGDLRVNYLLTSDIPYAEFRIIDMQGRALLGSRGPGVNGENQHAIDMRMLPAGRYILQMITPGEMNTTSVIVVR